MKGQIGLIFVIVMLLIGIMVLVIGGIIREEIIMNRAFYEREIAIYLGEMGYQRAIKEGSTEITVSEDISLFNGYHGTFEVMDYYSGEVTISVRLYKNSRNILDTNMRRYLIKYLKVSPEGKVYGGIGSTEVYTAYGYTPANTTIEITPYFFISTEISNLAIIDNSSGSFEVTNSPGTGEVWVKYGIFSVFTTFEVQ